MARLPTSRIPRAARFTSTVSGVAALSLHSPRRLTLLLSHRSGSQISPNGKYLYATQSNSTIGQLSIGASGTLSALSPATAAGGTGEDAIAITPNGSFLYLGNFGNVSASAISSFGVGGAGLLTPLSPATVGAGNGPTSLVISPDGSYLYCVNSNDATISQFSIGTGGALTPLVPATVAAGTGGVSNPQSAAVLQH